MNYLETNSNDTLNEQTYSGIIPQIIALGKDQGYVSREDLLTFLPEAEEDTTVLDEIFAALQGANILFVDSAVEVTNEDDDNNLSLEGNQTTKTDSNPLANVPSNDLVGLYLKEAAGLPLLTIDEEVHLAKKIERGQEAREALLRDDLEMAQRKALSEQALAGQDAFDRLIKSNVRLVISVAKKYQGRGLTLSDLIQAGNIGLIRAAKKFDYTRGFKFSTYATWWIRQAVTRALSEQSRTIRIPVHTSDTMGQISRLRADFIQKLNREPTYEEIGAQLDLSPQRVEEVIRLSKTPLSLDMPVGFEGDRVLGDFLEDEEASSPEEQTSRKLYAENIRKIFNQVLPLREARVLRLRFGFDNHKPLSLQEIGEREGITRERVRQIEATALRRLRRSNYKNSLRAFLN